MSFVFRVIVDIYSETQFLLSKAVQTPIKKSAPSDTTEPEIHKIIVKI
jgi:hypothetical protein